MSRRHACALYHAPRGRAVRGSALRCDRARARRRSRARAATTGPLIIVANHMSNADPPLLGGWLVPALRPRADVPRQGGALQGAAGAGPALARRYHRSRPAAATWRPSACAKAASWTRAASSPLARRARAASTGGSWHGDAGRHRCSRRARACTVLPVGISGTDVLIGRGRRLPAVRDPRHASLRPTLHARARRDDDRAPRSPRRTRSHAPHRGARRAAPSRRLGALAGSLGRVARAGTRVTASTRPGAILTRHGHRPRGPHRAPHRLLLRRPGGDRCRPHLGGGGQDHPYARPGRPQRGRHRAAARCRASAASTASTTSRTAPRSSSAPTA